MKNYKVYILNGYGKWWGWRQGTACLKMEADFWIVISILRRVNRTFQQKFKTTSYDSDFCLNVCWFQLSELKLLRANRDWFLLKSSRFYCCHHLICTVNLGSNWWCSADVTKSWKSYWNVWYFNFQAICKAELILVPKYGWESMHESV